LEAVEKRIQNDKIQAMREGLAKTLAQLDLERRNRIEEAEKLKKLGKKGEEAYNKEMLSITNLYEKKEFDIKKKWLDDWKNYQEQVLDQMEQRRRTYEQLDIDLKRNRNENWLDTQTMDTEVNAVKNLVRQIAMADDEMQKIIKESGVKDLLDKYLKNPTEEVLDEVVEILKKYNLEMQTTLGENGKPEYSFFDMVDAEEYYRTLTRINEIKREINELSKQPGLFDVVDDGVEVDEESLAKLNELQKRYDDLEAELNELYKSFDKTKMAMSNPYYLFHEWQVYYDQLYDVQKEYAEKTRDLKLSEIGFEENTAIYDENKEYEKAYKDLEDKYNQHLDDMQDLDNEAVQAALDHAGEMGEIYGWESEEYKEALAEYEALIPEQVALVKERDEKLKALTERHKEIIDRISENAEEKRLKAQNDFQRESQTATANYYSGLLNEFQVFQNKFMQKVDKLQEKSKNAWGIVDLSKYTKGINDLKSTFERMVDDLDEAQTELIVKLANNEISLGDFNTAYNELEDLKEQAQETIETLNDMGKNRIGEFIESINTYIQAVGQGVQELLSTVWDAQSAALDAQQEALEKANSELEKQLDKQQQITQRHADKINQIEDELSTARGDRRQHLIDALSAQIAAQRASLAAEQRIQKQKEANEKKQDALDKKRKEAQRKQDITSAIISTALATANGLATKPFVPVGIAMGALAAALGAAQVAIISSKHYAKGGLLEGPSHSQGGIPVGNTGIEVEGKEYIVNKRSTAKNLGLIDYINRSDKRLDITDIMDYFNSTASRSVKGFKTRYADGGELPTLSDNVEVVNPSQTVIFNQDDRPIWVSVKDINDAQARVRNVQVLAGMK
jgi:hypothetical protein